MSRLAHNEPFVSHLPSVFSAPDAGAVVVPRPLLESIGSEQLVAIDWEFEPRS